MFYLSILETVLGIFLLKTKEKETTFKFKT